MTEENIPEWPHKPAPPEPRRILPEWPMLIRGLGLLLLALLLLAVGHKAWRAPLWVKPASLVSVAGAFLALWAAAIHLTGGEKFDDHRWV